jgi:hypothetical protein
MIFVHLLLGIILGKLFGSYFFFILGSIFPDIDHIHIIIKYKLFGLKKIINSIKFEKKYNIRYKTAFVHSLLGLIIFSLIVALFNKQGAILFAIAYLLHLLIDWIDIDEKYYLYPLKIKFKGFLPIWSNIEKIITIILIILLILTYII